MNHAVTPTGWIRMPGQFVYRRSLVWTGYRNFNGEEWHTDIPVFGVKASHRHCYVVPPDPNDDSAITTINYVSDDIASALCIERLRQIRKIGDPWELPAPVEYDTDRDRIVPVTSVQFQTSDVFAERVIQTLHEQLIDGWDLGEIRVRLDRRDR